MNVQVRLAQGLDAQRLAEGRVGAQFAVVDGAEVLSKFWTILFCSHMFALEQQRDKTDETSAYR
jgi:hypothetical protein